MTGHLLGATGGIEAIFFNPIDQGWYHSTTNLEVSDPLCDLNYSQNQAFQQDVTIAPSNAFGFGGVNSSLIFRKLEDGDKA